MHIGRRCTVHVRMRAVSDGNSTSLGLHGHFETYTKSSSSMDARFAWERSRPRRKGVMNLETLAHVVSKNWLAFAHAHSSSDRDVHAEYCLGILEMFVLPEGELRHGVYEGSVEDLKDSVVQLRSKLLAEYDALPKERAAEPPPRVLEESLPVFDPPSLLRDPLAPENFPSSATKSKENAFLEEVPLPCFDACRNMFRSSARDWQAYIVPKVPVLPSAVSIAVLRPRRTEVVPNARTDMAQTLPVRQDLSCASDLPYRSTSDFIRDRIDGELTFSMDEDALPATLEEADREIEKALDAKNRVKRQIAMRLWKILRLFFISPLPKNIEVEYGERFPENCSLSSLFSEFEREQGLEPLSHGIPCIFSCDRNTSFLREHHGEKFVSLSSRDALSIVQERLRHALEFEVGYNLPPQLSVNDSVMLLDGIELPFCSGNCGALHGQLCKAVVNLPSGSKVAGNGVNAFHKRIEVALDDPPASDDDKSAQFEEWYNDTFPNEYPDSRVPTLPEFVHGELESEPVYRPPPLETPLDWIEPSNAPEDSLVYENLPQFPWQSFADGHDGVLVLFDRSKQMEPFSREMHSLFLRIISANGPLGSHCRRLDVFLFSNVVWTFQGSNFVEYQRVQRGKTLLKQSSESVKRGLGRHRFVDETKYRQLVVKEPVLESHLCGAADVQLKLADATEPIKASLRRWVNSSLQDHFAGHCGLHTALQVALNMRNPLEYNRVIVITSGIVHKENECCSVSRSLARIGKTIDFISIGNNSKGLRFMAKCASPGGIVVSSNAFTSVPASDPYVHYGVGLTAYSVAEALHAAAENARLTKECSAIESHALAQSSVKKSHYFRMYVDPLLSRNEARRRESEMAYVLEKERVTFSNREKASLLSKHQDYCKVCIAQFDRSKEFYLMKRIRHREALRSKRILEARANALAERSKLRILRCREIADEYYKFKLLRNSMQSIRKSSHSRGMAQLLSDAEEFQRNKVADLCVITARRFRDFCCDRGILMEIESLNDSIRSRFSFTRVRDWRERNKGEFRELAEDRISLKKCKLRESKAQHMREQILEDRVLQNRKFKGALVAKSKDTVEQVIECVTCWDDYDCDVKLDQLVHEVVNEAYEDELKDFILKEEADATNAACASRSRDRANKILRENRIAHFRRMFAERASQTNELVENWISDNSEARLQAVVQFVEEAYSADAFLWKMSGKEYEDYKSKMDLWDERRISFQERVTHEHSAWGSSLRQNGLQSISTVNAWASDLKSVKTANREAHDESEERFIRALDKVCEHNFNVEMRSFDKYSLHLLDSLRHSVNVARIHSYARRLLREIERCNRFLAVLEAAGGNQKRVCEMSTLTKCLASAYPPVAFPDDVEAHAHHLEEITAYTPFGPVHLAHLDTPESSILEDSPFRFPFGEPALVVEKAISRAKEHALGVYLSAKPRFRGE